MKCDPCPVAARDRHAERSVATSSAEPWRAGLLLTRLHSALRKNDMKDDLCGRRVQAVTGAARSGRTRPRVRATPYDSATSSRRATRSGTGGPARSSARTRRAALGGPPNGSAASRSRQQARVRAARQARAGPTTSARPLGDRRPQYKPKPKAVTPPGPMLEKPLPPAALGRRPPNRRPRRLALIGLLHRRARRTRRARYTGLLDLRPLAAHDREATVKTRSRFRALRAAPRLQV